MVPGFAVAQWLRCCATNRKVAASILAGVIGMFHWHNPSHRTGSTQSLTEMITRSISCGKGGRRIRLTTLPPYWAVVTKSGNLNFLEPSGPLQACSGTALPLMAPGLVYCSYKPETFIGTLHQKNICKFNCRKNETLLIYFFPQLSLCPSLCQRIPRTFPSLPDIHLICSPTLGVERSFGQNDTFGGKLINLVALNKIAVDLRKNYYFVSCHRPLLLYSLVLLLLFRRWSPSLMLQFSDLQYFPYYVWRSVCFLKRIY